MMAVRHGHMAIAEQLIISGASISKRNSVSFHTVRSPSPLNCVFFLFFFFFSQLYLTPACAVYSFSLPTVYT